MNNGCISQPAAQFPWCLAVRLDGHSSPPYSLGLFAQTSRLLKPKFLVPSKKRASEANTVGLIKKQRKGASGQSRAHPPKNTDGVCFPGVTSMCYNENIYICTLVFLQLPK